MTRLLAALSLLAIPCISFAQSAVTLVPQEAFVGDRVELRFRADGLNIAKPIRLAADDIPPSPDADIESIALEPISGGASVSIVFVPWKPGDLSLPPFRASGARVVPPSCRVASIVEKTGARSLAPPRGPLLVPGTTYGLYAAILGALVAFSFALFVWLRVRPWLGRSSRSARSGRRTRLALRRLRRLERVAGRTQATRWRREFVLALRAYLADLLDAQIAARTNAEVADLLPAEGPRASVADLLARSDRVRYGYEPSIGDEASDARLALELVGALEAAEANDAEL